MSGEPQTRPLTEEEEHHVPIDHFNAYYSFIDKRIYAEWHEQEVYSLTGKFPWYFRNTHEKVRISDYKKYYPYFNELEDFDFETIQGKYKSKTVSWNFADERWVYRNHKPVRFGETPESTTPQEQDPPRTPTNPSNPRTPSQESSDQAEVSQLLESATQKVTALITHISQPQTPQTVPGGLPVTPAQQTSQSYLPTPTATSSVLPPVIPPSRAVTPPPKRTKTPIVTVPPQTTSTMATGSGSGGGAGQSTKLLGAAPEPFDGKPEKAESFWNNLENYYYLNGDAYSNESKKVSSALTHFKIGTSAREWAQDQQKRALRVMSSFSTNPRGGFFVPGLCARVD